MAKKSNIVVFLEGGLVVGVVNLSAKRPELGVPYEVMDYDVLEDDSAAEVREYIGSRSPKLLKYMQRHLPEEWQELQACVKEGSK